MKVSMKKNMIAAGLIIFGALLVSEVMLFSATNAKIRVVNKTGKVLTITTRGIKFGLNNGTKIAAGKTQKFNVIPASPNPRDSFTIKITCPGADNPVIWSMGLGQSANLEISLSGKSLGLNRKAISNKF